MSNYIDLKLLEDEGEERDALLHLLSQSLEEATEHGVGQVTVVMRYRRRFQQDGRLDGPRTVRPLRISASTANADRVLDQVIGRLREGFGRGFQGQVIVGVEDPDHPGEVLAGVWDRELTYGDAADSPYRMDEDPAAGSWAPRSEQPPRRSAQPDRGGFSDVPTPPTPTPLTQGNWDPGQLGAVGNPEDRELIRSVIGAQERRADIAQAELRARDSNFFRMLDYNQRLNHQFMQLLGMVFGRWVPPAIQQGPPPMNPMAALVTTVLGAVLPGIFGQPATPTPSPGQPSTVAPPPPRIEPPPAFRPSFYEPAGAPEDIRFEPGAPVYGTSFRDDGGAFDPHAAAHAGFRPPQNEREWAAAMKADPEGAKRAAAQLVPSAFKRLLDPNSPNS